MPLASPVLLIVAIAGFEEVHLVCAVTSPVLPPGSWKVPVAVNCWVVPCRMVALAGPIETATTSFFPLKYWPQQPVRDSNGKTHKATLSVLRKRLFILGTS